MHLVSYRSLKIVSRKKEIRGSHSSASQEDRLQVLERRERLLVEPQIQEEHMVFVLAMKPRTSCIPS